MGDTRRRVLLVEDNRDDAVRIEYLLSKKSEFQVDLTHAYQLSDALEILQTDSFDAALIDLSLPDEDGTATFRAVRAACRSMPIVVLTGLDDEQIALETLRHGAQDYLLKDEVNSKLLVRSLRYAIERQRTDELKALNRRLSRLYKTAHRFVDDVSHEFRTPLTVIKEYVSLINDGVVGEVSDEQRKLLSVVEDRADDLNTMVDDMLDVSKLESGLLGAYRETCTVDQIVRAVWPSLERKAAVKGVALNLHVDEDLPEVYCDLEKAGRVFVNLTTNAIKFCGDPGVVSITCHEPAGSCGVEISVRDNGPGIDEVDLQAIFQRFKQVGSPVRSGTKGFGLGLNIAKELVDVNLGEIRVDSRVGEGSTFSFTLPPSDPCQVVDRYLDRIMHVRNGSSVVSLLEASVDEHVTIATADDVGVLLNHVLRRNDLLFRAGLHSWLLVLPIPDTELDSFRARVGKTYDEINRNRPAGRLPAVDMQTLGTWNVGRDAGEIRDAFAQALGAKETVSV